MKKTERWIINEWQKLPDEMKNKEVLMTLEQLCKKRGMLKIKRAADVCISLLLIAGLSPVMAAAAIVVAAESEGGILFRQRRITQYGRVFEILKFRTMYVSEREGSLLTAADDSRITKVGKVLRKTKTDELPQLFNVLRGEMSLVGVRPEVERFVQRYTPQMMTTLLLPAGMTSPASLAFSNEEQLLSRAKDREREYIEKILPQKMKLNIDYLENFSLKKDAGVLLKTVSATVCLAKNVLKKKNITHHRRTS
ncbi:MAG: sugar transferase [Oscillospiraceae bacterium]|nr:sugar transferase [Oscillospiraceae bacterium]